MEILKILKSGFEEGVLLNRALNFSLNITSRYRLIATGTSRSIKVEVFELETVDLYYGLEGFF